MTAQATLMHSITQQVVLSIHLLTDVFLSLPKIIEINIGFLKCNQSNNPASIFHSRLKTYLFNKSFPP